jgi:3'-phosphoadenosine 5'-phosphosulfate sulfotransferase (PAPS reductase)/FAD synthetase
MGALITAKENFHAVSLSGGKDSTCLLLLMIERGLPIDAVIWADTGMEFPEMYGHISKVDEHLYRERGLHITTLRSPKSFEYMMFDEPKQKPSTLENRARLGVPPYGNGWPGIKVRWCTGQLKTHQINKELTRLKGQHRLQQYVGIAADEAHRCKDLHYPLVDWGITEAQALQLCYDRGFDFGGLYRIYHRASCWCCPFQRIGSCEIYAIITRSCGRACWIWITVRGHSSAPARWDNSNKAGVWRVWRNGLRVRTGRPPPFSPMLLTTLHRK